MLRSMYQVFIDQLDCLGLKAKEDVIFTPWEKQVGRENEVQVLRGASKKIEDLFKEFQGELRLGEVVPEGIYIPEDAQLPKATLKKLLAAVGITVDKDARVLLMTDACARGLMELYCGLGYLNLKRC